MTLYRLTNSVNGKAYIGITTRPLKARLALHKSAALQENKRSIICSAIRKYGWDAFTVDVLAEPSSHEKLKDMERAAIGHYKTKYPLGYNMTFGGDGTWGCVCTEERRQKIAAKVVGRPRNNGAFIAKPKTEEPAKWKGFSPTHRANLSASILASRKIRPVTENNVPITINGAWYPTMGAAVRDSGYGRRHIWRMVRAGDPNFVRAPAKPKSAETRARMSRSLRAFHFNKRK